MERAQQILKLFAAHQRLTTAGIAGQLRISRQAVHRHLQALLSEGKLLRRGSGPRNTFYLLNTPAALRAASGTAERFRKRYASSGLQEDRVYEEVRRQITGIDALPTNVATISRYAFTEMLNNAIEHARSSFISITLELSPTVLRCVIDDRGVGIFENIQSKKGLADEWEAIQDLMKGKQTTAPETHSGEGIFFTSKVVDRLVLESHRKLLVMDNRIDDVAVNDIRARTGTRVIMEIDRSSRRRLEEIFRRFTDDQFRFQKSFVRVKLFERGTEFVSRSEARRLLHGLDAFSKIELDFRGVRTVGQGFADEIFRVFRNRHPAIQILAERMNDNVRFMVERARTAAPG